MPDPRPQRFDNPPLVLIVCLMVSATCVGSMLYSMVMLVIAWRAGYVLH